MRNFVCGDIHNNIDIMKITAFNRTNKDLTKNDIVICAGDFGFPWDNSDSDLYWMKWFENNFRPTMVFVDGNHEQYNLLYNFPIIEKWGGKVHKINDSIFHLMRGEVYIINGQKIFAFGGAYSIDKHRRVEGISWWPEEIPNKKEEDYGIINLEKHNNKVDYIITHDCGFQVPYVHHFNEENSLKKYLSFIEKNIDYKRWYFGHHHIDFFFKEHNALCMYDKIIEIK